MSKEYKEELKEWFKVSKMADLMGCSVVTVHNRLKKVDNGLLIPLRKIEKGVTYYNIKIFDILQPKEEQPPEMHQEAAQGNYIDDYIKSLNEQIEHLKSQIEAKDEQLTTKDRLLENMQVLLKNRQQDIKLLEPETQEKEKQGFFKRLFRRGLQ